MNDKTIFGKAVWLSLLQKQKRSNATHKPTQVASHLLLPNRTKNYL